MNILITGSHGFVGRAFRRALPHANLTLVDLKNGVDCRKFFQLDKKQYDLVIHLAAVVGGRMMIENEPLALAVDLAIDAEFATWAMRTIFPIIGRKQENMYHKGFHVSERLTPLLRLWFAFSFSIWVCSEGNGKVRRRVEGDDGISIG